MLCSETVTAAATPTAAVAGGSAVTAIAACPTTGAGGAPVASDTAVNAVAAAVSPRLRLPRLWVRLAMGRVCECLQPKGHRCVRRFDLERNRSSQFRPALRYDILLPCRMAACGLRPGTRVADGDLHGCRVGDES